MLTQPIYTQCQVDNIHNMHMITVNHLINYITGEHFTDGNNDDTYLQVLPNEAVVDDDDYI